MTNNQRGKIAEFIARTLLRIKGYKIIERNYMTGKGTHAGEVDIIACKHKVLVFVEVKKRLNLELAAYAISQHQKQRLINAANAFLKKHPSYNSYDVRFDAVLIKFPYHF